ncbi:amidohydrolase family protein [Halobellus rufus]|uniref:amidohydrolase family protein n=1 Tax=Halobellus rufus TaxID=1448860 RepID=UPI0009E05D90|nr:amidohydrolase family protein [Halobellus rufus]
MKPASNERNLPFDFGAHIHPKSVLPDLPEGLSAVLGDRHHDIDKLVKWFESAGYGGAALSQPIYMGHRNLDLVQKANDVLLEQLEDYNHFFGLAAIPTAAGGEVAAKEFKRCLNEGYSGGAIATKSDGIELHDEEAEPILEVANQTGAPILVHPKLDDSLHPDVLGDKYRLNAVFGRETALSESIFKVVHDGILDQYPNLNLVYHHLGGNIPAMMGRIHLQLDEGRWPGQKHIKNFDEFKQQVENRVYLDTSGFFGYQAPLRVALEQMPVSQVLFGTDAPYEPRSKSELQKFATSVREVAPRSDAQKILGENALDLLVNT